jgi:23S rRNA maturation mini-RNase III
MSDELEIRQMQPAVLAFMGDAVFNLFIRERLVLKKGDVPSTAF